MKKIVFLAVVCSFLMTSCYKIVYMEDMKTKLRYPIPQKAELRIQQGDRLRIHVSSKRPDLAAPFNVGVIGYQVGMDGELKTGTNVPVEPGYLVDNDGNINFPVLGKITVEGLTMNELSELIQETLAKRSQLSDALVTVTLLNLKITVIGEVGNPGVLSKPCEKMTLLDAVVLAGGLTLNAREEEVWVIREERGVLRKITVNMRTVNMYHSPGFYLQQNDIVYAVPRSAQSTIGETRFWQYFNTVLGLGGTAMSILLLINYYKK